MATRSASSRSKLGPQIELTTAFAKRGLIAEHGSAWMLPRLIGPMNALDLLYSARMVDTAEAERLGLVRQLPADNFCAHVQAIARELVTASSPCSIGVIKRQVFQSYFQSLAEARAVADKKSGRHLSPGLILPHDDTGADGHAAIKISDVVVD